MTDRITRPRKSLAHHTLVGLLILLVAAFGRFVLFGEVPPGLQHDEIFKAQEGVALIEQGDFRLFYPTNQGHEGAFVWLLGLSYALVGKNLLMVKLPALFCGLITVALTYRFAAEACNRRVAFVAGGLMAVSFFGLYSSRVGLRAVMLPMVALLVLWGLHRVWMLTRQPNIKPARIWRVATLTGLALGFAIYTYTSSFALYAAVSAFGLALVVFDRKLLQKNWRVWAIIMLLGLVMAAPMVVIRFTDPEGSNRVSTITRPLNDALVGQPAELIGNAWGLVGMAYFTGDPEWRYNVAGRALFETPVGWLVYLGLLVALWRIRRQPLNAALLALVVIGLIPSLLTVSAPSFLRSIVVLPVVMFFIGLAIDLLPWKRLVWAAAMVTIAVSAITDWHAYFVQWPSNDEVHAIYRDDLQQLAERLRDLPSETTVLVSTPDTTLDPLIYEYYHRPGAPLPSFFDGRTNIALGTDALLFISPLSPISPPHADWLSSDNGTEGLPPVIGQDGRVAFDVLRIDPDGSRLAERLDIVQQQSVYLYNGDRFPRDRISAWAESLAYPVNFGGVVALTGVELPRQRIASQRDGVNIQLYFRPLIERVEMPLNVFVHMSRRSGEVHAQRDLLGMPSLQWDRDLIFIQDNFVIAGPTPPGRYMISLGVYDFVTGQRLPVLDASGDPLGDRVLIDFVRIVEAP